MVANPSLKSEEQVFDCISSALFPVLHAGDTGLYQDLRQRDYLAVIYRETLFSRNFLQGGQYNFAWRGYQLAGGRAPPGGARRFPACQREHCSTALAKSAEDTCSC